MSATKAHIIKTIDGYYKAIVDEVEKRCVTYCEDLCKAAIRFRLAEPEAHNYTGNLLNSIVVCLYRQKKPTIAFYATDYIEDEIRVKMTAPSKYVFSHDWDNYYRGGSRPTAYRPKVPTDEGRGRFDAKDFFAQYKPQGSNLFDIIVAYTVEYAEFAANGIMGTYDHADKVGITFLQLPRV